MNFQFYMEKLNSSEEFRKFKKENPSVYLCSGFFSIDKIDKGKDNQQHLDFFIPEVEKMFSFKINEDPVEMLPVDNLTSDGEKFIPEKIKDNYDFDFNDIEKMIESKMFDEKINNKIQKLLFSIQGRDGRDFIIGTVFISGLGILKVVVDLDKKEIVNFEKKSFFDMMKIVRNNKDKKANKEEKKN